MYRYKNLEKNNFFYVLFKIKALFKRSLSIKIPPNIMKIQRICPKLKKPNLPRKTSLSRNISVKALSKP